jgi:hypothetical protein
MSFVACGRREPDLDRVRPWKSVLAKRRTQTLRPRRAISAIAQERLQQGNPDES